MAPVSKMGRTATNKVAPAEIIKATPVEKIK